MQFDYEMLCREGKIKPYNQADLKSTDVQINSTEVNIDIESAIQYQKEAEKFLNYNSSFTDKKNGIDLLKKAESIYSDLNKKAPIDIKNIDEQIKLCIQIANQNSHINGNDYIAYYLKASDIAEKNKLYLYLPSLNKDIAVYYYQKAKNNTLAEKYFDKSIYYFEQSIKNTPQNSTLDDSFLIIYLEPSNFHTKITKNYKKVASYKAKIVELYKKYIYSKNPNFDTTTQLVRWKNSYTQVLFALKEYEKAKILLLENIKMLNDFKKYKANANQITTLEYISTHDLRQLGDVYLFTYNFIKAEETFINYIKIKEKNVPNKDVYYYKDFLGIYKKLVFIYQSTGQKKKENQALNEIKLINTQIKKLQLK